MYYRVIHKPAELKPWSFEILVPHGWLPYPKEFATRDMVHGFTQVWCGMTQFRDAELGKGWDN